MIEAFHIFFLLRHGDVEAPLLQEDHGMVCRHRALRRELMAPAFCTKQFIRHAPVTVGLSHYNPIVYSVLCHDDGCEILHQLENCGKLWKMVENCGKWWKMMENGGKLWKIVENDGKRWKTVENCGKWWKMVEDCGKW